MSISRTDQEMRNHRKQQAERIIEVVQNNQDSDDEYEVLEAVTRIIEEPIPLDERQLNEDKMGVSPDVLDPCGSFASIEDLRWFMGEYPDCFDMPGFWDY